MPQFLMKGGSHVEDGKYYASPKGEAQAVVESERDLVSMFPGKFTLVEGAKASAGVPDPTAPIRRTAASETQQPQKPNRGHEVPIGSSPPAEVDEEHAHAAQNALEGEEPGDFSDPDYDMPQNGTPLVESRKKGQAAKPQPAKVQKTQAAKAQAAKAQSAPADEDEEEEDEEDAEAESEEDEDVEEEDEEEDAEDVTADFKDAKALKLTVEKADGKYTVATKQGEPVGRKSGYTTKKEVNDLLKKQAKKQG